MQVKTVKELKDLIICNDGKLTIGPLRITTSESGAGDIDFSLNGLLMMWIDSSVSDDEEISENVIYHTTDLLKKDEKIAELNKNKDQLHADKIEALNKLKTVEDELSSLREGVKNAEAESIENKGMIKAYEKLLLGRNLTINK